MKTLLNIVLGLGFVLSAGLASAAEPTPHGVPYLPVGKLSVDKDMVRNGVNPEVDWDITYPVSITDIVDIDPDTRKLTVKRSATMRVRVVGVAFQSGPTHLPCALWVRTNSNTWTAAFMGKYDEVEPEDVVWSAEVSAGSTIDIAGRGQMATGGWYTPRWTLDSSPTCCALKDGDEFPEVAPAYSQGTIESFLSGYVSDDNRAVLGPRDLIYIFECYSTTPGSHYFDLQDLVVLLTFEEM